MAEEGSTPVTHAVHQALPTGHAPTADNALLAEGDDSDVDSTYSGSIAGTDTTSIASSVYNYKYQNGRRYQSYREGQYILPNDEQEQGREDMLHHIYRLVLGGPLYRAPIVSLSGQGPSRILDLGTGTGIWCMEVADELPESIVEGVDLSPIQSKYVPPNCYFVIDDFEANWGFQADKKFDYIHGRALAACVADWPKLFRQAYDQLNPGGFIEFQEYHCRIYSDDGTDSLTPDLLTWAEDLAAAAEKFGKLLPIGDRIGPWMRDTGFEDVTEDVYKVPIGPWAKDPRYKELGFYYRAQFLEAVEPFTLALYTNILGYSYEQAQATIALVRKDLMNRKAHLYAKFYFTYGRKGGNVV